MFKLFRLTVWQAPFSDCFVYTICLSVPVLSTVQWKSFLMFLNFPAVLSLLLSRQPAGCDCAICQWEIFRKGGNSISQSLENMKNANVSTFTITHKPRSLNGSKKYSMLLKKKWIKRLQLAMSIHLTKYLYFSF